MTAAELLQATMQFPQAAKETEVANAGILEKAKIGSFTEEHFDRLFAVNLKGLVFTVQKAPPLMPDGAAVILMSSIVAGKGLGNNCLYAGRKRRFGFLHGDGSRSFPGFRASGLHKWR